MFTNGSLEVKLAQFFAAVSAALFVPGTGLAQAAAPALAGPALVAGAVIFDPQGGEVGKIDSVADDAVVIDTGTHRATLPKSAFGTGAKGPTITVTKAQIDAQVGAALDKTAAELNAALAPGAEVRGKSGVIVGTIKEVNGDQVIVDRVTGPVSLAKKAFASGPQGLVISLTAAELDAAAKAISPKP